MAKYLLGIDVGTTSLKVAVIDENAKILGIASSKYKLLNLSGRAEVIENGTEENKTFRVFQRN